MRPIRTSSFIQLSAEVVEEGDSGWTELGGGLGIHAQMEYLLCVSYGDLVK